MRAGFLSALIALLLAQLALPQGTPPPTLQAPAATAAPAPNQPPPSAPAASPSVAQPSQSAAGRFALEDGTPLKLRIGRTVSSADAQVGETVDFEVLEEVRVNDVEVVPKGGVAWGTVTEAQPKRRLGRAGKLGINIDSVRLMDGERAALRAVKDVKGAGHGGAVTGAVVATAIVFWPAAPPLPPHSRQGHSRPQGDGDHRLHQR